MAIRIRESEAPVTFEIHPAANLFPEMTDEESKNLMVDIRENGQREPIVLFQGKVIDGRNRLRACRWLGFEPKTREYQGREEDIVAFVTSLNLHRRHLTDGQRAMVANRIASMRQGARTDVKPSANLPEVSQPAAAKMMNVSERSVRTAKTIVAKGGAEVAAAVDSGAMSLNEAAKVVKLRPDQQKAVISMPPAQRRETLKGCSIEELGVIGARQDPFTEHRFALIRIMGDLAALTGTPEQLITDMPKFMARDLNVNFGKVFMKMQALHAAYQNWEHRNVHHD